MPEETAIDEMASTNAQCELDFALNDIRQLATALRDLGIGGAEGAPEISPDGLIGIGGALKRRAEEAYGHFEALLRERHKERRARA